MNQPSGFQIAETAPAFKGDYLYYAYNGHLVYGYVKAKDKADAIRLCKLIREEVEAAGR